MGFLSDLGTGLGTLAGGVLGAPFAIAGEILNSDYIKEIGEGVFKVTQRTGDLLGNFSEGVAETIYGVATSDQKMASEGFEKAADSTVSYVSGIVKGTVGLAVKGIDTFGAILEGDMDKTLKVGSELLKIGVVAGVAFTIGDVVGHVVDIDGIDDVDDIVSADDADEFDGIDDAVSAYDADEFDGIDDVVSTDDADEFDNIDDGSTEDTELIENNETHFVNAYWRTLSDGRKIWVDGDGDTTVDTVGGWVQSNPDFRV
ncbi:MAG: hypothetical protein LBS21_01060 [Clostridiales bacterium]|nr:hypothetical protein [Clostridiales bacterium]